MFVRRLRTENYIFNLKVEQRGRWEEKRRRRGLKEEEGEMWGGGDEGTPRAQSGEGESGGTLLSSRAPRRSCQGPLTACEVSAGRKMMTMNGKQHFSMHPALHEPKYPGLHAGSEGMRRVCLPAPQVRSGLGRVMAVCRQRGGKVC